MTYLIRINIPQKDRANIEVETLDKALSILKESKSSITKQISWLNYTDLFFKNKNHYIRIKNGN